MTHGCVLFDWGDTLMVDFDLPGPMASWPRVEAVLGAVDTLEALRAQGWLICLATNAADSNETDIRAALARVGIDSLIDRIYCSRAVGYPKPHPAFFQHISADTGFPPSEMVMVGDNLANDVLGAVRAGLRAVLLHPGSAVCAGGKDWWTVGSLSDVPALIDTIGRR